MQTNCFWTISQGKKMLILHNDGIAENNQENSIAAVFGVGLIGMHLIQSLYRRSYKFAYKLPFSWGKAVHRLNENSVILNSIRDLLKTGMNADVPDLNSQCRIDFVWSAGKGGFSMPESEILSEINSFSDVLALAVTVARENPSCMVRFHLLSSAGGLFEGQRNVGGKTAPCAKRPYAVMKLKQEQILESRNDMVQFVYRATSVYGFAGLNRRLGLIPTLLWNGSRNNVSSIFGTPDTLRDYVWAGDVGSFIADKILSKTSESETFILASGKPSSVFEIFRHVEKILNKKLFCHYISDGGNTEHNTFNITTWPKGWGPSQLETGISKTHNCMFSNLMEP